MSAATSITGVLLAAGLSTRMGAAKPLLDWFGAPLVAYQVAQLHAAGANPVLVVTGHEAARVEQALAGTDAVTVRNPRYREGRASSIRAAAEAIREPPDRIVLLNVDQPRHAAIMARLLDEHARLGGAITVPVFAGRRGHPVVLAGSLLPELRLVSEAEQGLKAVVRRHAAERRELPFTDEEVLFDLNDPEAYARALSTWAGQTSQLEARRPCRS